MAPGPSWVSQLSLGILELQEFSSQSPSIQLLAWDRKFDIPTCPGSRHLESLGVEYFQVSLGLEQKMLCILTVVSVSILCWLHSGRQKHFM